MIHRFTRWLKGMHPCRKEMQLVVKLFSKLTDREREIIIDKYCYKCGKHLSSRIGIRGITKCKCGNIYIYGLDKEKK